VKHEEKYIVSMRYIRWKIHFHVSNLFASLTLFVTKLTT